MSYNKKAPHGGGAKRASSKNHRDQHSTFSAKGQGKAAQVVRTLAAVYGAKSGRR